MDTKDIEYICCACNELITFFFSGKMFASTNPRCDYPSVFFYVSYSEKKKLAWKKLTLVRQC